MSKEREALKRSLEALESGVKTTANLISWVEYDSELIKQAITVIKEALAQPAQEPYRVEQNLYGEEIKLYTAPPAAQPAREPNNFCPRCGKRRGGDVNYIHTCTPPLWGYK